MAGSLWLDFFIESRAQRVPAEKPSSWRPDATRRRVQGSLCF